MKMKFFALCILGLICLNAINALSCSGQWECSSVTDDYNYVGCSGGQCVCRKDLGFVGSATTSDKCRCIAGNTVYWKSSLPYCLNYQDAVDSKRAEDKVDIMMTKVEQLYNNFVYPTPAIIINQLIGGTNELMKDVFALDAHGRVDPVGTYTDFDGIVEYFFATIYQEFSHVIDVFKLALTADAATNMVSARYVITFNTTIYGTGQYFQWNIIQSGHYYFNDALKIKGTELILHFLGKASDQGTPPGFQTNYQACYIYFASGCNQQNDPNGYYVDMTDCLNHMSTLKHGTWSDVPSNTVVCRIYHGMIAPVRPNIHCAHMGKTGGGKCVDHTTYEYFLTNYLS